MNSETTTSMEIAIELYLDEVNAGKNATAHFEVGGYPVILANGQIVCQIGSMPPEQIDVDSENTSVDVLNFFAIALALNFKIRPYAIAVNSTAEGDWPIVLVANVNRDTLVSDVQLLHQALAEVLPILPRE